VTLEARDLRLAGRLDGISATFEPGAITAICGPNGAGKSSLIETLAGLLMPDGGAVLLGGEPLAALHPRERARRIGYLPQHGEVAWDLSVRALAMLGRLPHGDRAAGPRELRVELERAAREVIRVEIPEHDGGVGHRRLGGAAAVTRRSRL
jgi:iron complex transport system ATP-binding protein